jgi:hypothetical protein
MRRVPVQEHDRIATTRVDTADVRIEHADATARLRIGGIDGGVGHG